MDTSTRGTTRPGAGRRLTSARPLHVLKFGGSSVGEVSSFRSVVEITRRTAQTRRVVVVVSALSGVTDLLVQAADTLKSGATQPDEWIMLLSERHQSFADDVLTHEPRRRYRIFLQVHLAALRRHFERLAAGGYSSEIREEILATGERLAAPLLTLALEQAGLAALTVDGTQLIRTNDTYGNARAHLRSTNRTIRRWYRSLPERTIPVVTGFIGRTNQGTTTTLGRGGSDYTAALLAGALEAALLERWTDTDGIYTDDPRQNPRARRLNYLFLDEALTKNQAGRLGMHPHTLEPLVAASVPLRIGCTRTPQTGKTLLLPPRPPRAASPRPVVCTV